MRALLFTLSLAVGGPAFAVRGPAPPEPAELDLDCTELRRAVRRALPMVRRGRVEVSGCARFPGVRAVVVLRPGRGVIGDPLELAAAPKQQRLKDLVLDYKREPLVFVGDRGDPARAVAEALAPVALGRVVVHPGGFSIDLVLRPDEQPPPPIWLDVAAGALEADLRVYTDGSWTMARIAAEEALPGALNLDEASSVALIDHGILRPADLVGVPAAPLSRAVAVPLHTAQAWIDAAAQWTEYAASPDGPRRGW